MSDRIERAQVASAAVMAVCAAAMFVSGLFFKSTRSAGSMMWLDGVNPWVGWAVLGGLVILALLVIGWWFDHWLVPAVMAGLLFARAGFTASAYRNRLESGIENHPLYTEQSLALGLMIVPVVAVVGSFCAGLLALVELLRMINARADGSAGRPGLKTQAQA